MTSVLFENHHLYYLPNFLPIIEEMQSRGSYDITVSMPFFVDELERTIFMDTCELLKLNVIYGNTEEDRLKTLKESEFDIVMVGNVGQLNNVVSKNTVAVMVYHGIGLKQTYYRDIDPRIDIRAVESQTRYEELISHGHQNLVLTGFTKCDPLIGQGIEKEIELVKLGLNPKQKTLLYAPSFYPTSLEKLIFHIEELAFEFNILIKLHNFSWHQDRYIYQSKAMKTLEEKNSNIFLARPEHFNIIPFYLLSDLLISDISSTLYEFLPLNRPLIMAECFTLRMKHRVFKNRFLKKIDLNRMEKVDFAYRLAYPENLSTLVYHALDYPEELQEERQLAQKEYLYKMDGKASKRIVDAIENSVKKRTT